MKKPGTSSLPACLLVIALAASACSTTKGSGGAAPSASAGGQGAQIAAQVASVDLFTGSPQRVLVGLIAQDGRLVSYGQLAFAFAFGGAVESPTPPQPGPDATATFLPTLGTSADRSTPALTQQSEARGVYQADGVTFDRAGIWTVTVTGAVEGVGNLETSASFQVFDAPHLPAPGQAALLTDNLTLDSKDAPEAAIDSRFTTDGEIPDPELHRWTIAEAVRRGVPALVIFATPVFCTSRFCGPATDEVARLEKTYGDRAAFIHVEIWRDFQNQVVNRAAADWLFRDDNLTEPWLYLIGPDGRILDRWGALWDPGEVVAELKGFPVQKDLERAP